MDLTRYAKWGIHVKEEPDFLDTPQSKEADASNVLDNNRGWMCKFPCDAQAAFNVSFADSIPNGLQEPIEASLPSYTVDYPEPFEINSHVTSTISRESEETENLDCVTQLCTVGRKDNPGKKNLEENSFSKILNVHGAAEKEELASNEAAVVPHDVHQQGVICFNFGNIQKNVTHFANETNRDKYGEVSNGVENQRELEQNSSLELIDNATQNISAVENADENTDLFSSSQKFNLPKGICSLIKDFITETDQQEKCLEKKSPKKTEHLSFKCPDCHRIIKRNSGFITHMKLHCMNEEPETYDVKCKNCKELFKDKKSLSLHKRVCKSSKKSSMNSVCSDKNGDVFVSMRLLGENICKDHHFESSQKNSKESSSFKVNSYQNTDDFFLKNVSVEESNFRQHGKIQSSKRSSEEKSKQSNTKKRRLSHSFTECCSENSGLQGIEEGCYTVQNGEQRCKSVDVDYQESWFSEIKSDKDEKVQNSKSIILSLRRFRFRKPKVLVKRAKIPNHILNMSETKSLTSSDTSNVIINTQTHFHGDNLVYNCNDNDHAPKHLMSESETISDSDTDKILNLQDSNTLASSEKHVSLPDSFCAITSSKPFQRENNTNSYSSYNLNEQPLKGVDIEKTGHTFPEESNNDRNSPNPDVFNSPFTKLNKPDTIISSLQDEAKNKCTSKLPKESKISSDLKIKIKPVVVLNRIGLLEYVNQDSTSAKETPKNCIKKTETPPKYCDKTTAYLQFTLPNNCNVQSFQNSSERLFSSEMNSSDQSHSGDVLVSTANNLNSRDCCSKNKNQLVTENVSQSFTEKLVMPNTTPSLPDDVCKNKCQSDSENSFETLEKRYGLKKCYVKLTRIDVDNDVVKLVKTFNDNTETISELRTCEKLKLHRTNSESWEVSPVKSCIQKTVPMIDTSHVEFKELTKENNRKKKYHPTNTTKILCESSEISGKNQNLALKAYDLKPFRARCSWCQKLYFNQEEFGEHVKTHFVGYTCPNCSAKFHFWMELQTHLSGCCSLASSLNCQNNKPIQECEVII